MYVHLQLQNLSEQTKEKLRNSPIVCQCNLFKRVNAASGLNISQQIKYSQINLKIQIRNDHVLLLRPEDGQILTGFECSVDKTFKLIRDQIIDNQETGKLVGIEFRSKNFLKKSIYLYLYKQNEQKEQENLERFAIILGRKYIFQDGFHQIYRAIKKIGKGVTASVYSALRLTDKKQFAVKSFKKQIFFNVDNGRGKDAFYKEFRTLTLIDSQHLCQLVSVFQSDNSIYIVMELLSISLYQYLKLNGLPSLKITKPLMFKLLLGLKHLHKNNIMHRDLKLDNIMIFKKDNQIEPKIIDFGLAQSTLNSTFIYVKCGTPGYVAPQILNLKVNQIPSPPYLHHCDVFSLGVIFYILLVGKTLFDSTDEKQMVKKNRQCDIDYQFSNESKLTDQMKDILRKMLEKDPNKRATAQNLLYHSFFRNNTQQALINQKQFIKQEQKQRI